MKLCLVMIVKNEAHVIERCLKSLLPHISYWVISDTGSRDQTREIIREVLKDIPGELHEDEWVHFAHNRTKVIQRAKGKGDYLLMMDADHVWYGKLPDDLKHDGYAIEHHYDYLRYGIPILMRGDLEWKYECPIHETIVGLSPGTQPFITLPSPPYVKVYHEGARSKDPDTYRKDAAILQKHVDEHPDDTRAVYYLAQSYWNAGMIPEAREWYQKRMLMEGWWEEKWHATYRTAQTAQAMKPEPLDFAIVMTEYLSAYQANPSRAEPLVTLARYARMQGYHAITVMCARQAMTIPKPATGLFLESVAYDWVAQDEFAVSSYYIGNKAEGLKMCQKLLQNPLLPSNERPRVEANVAWFKGEAAKAA